MYRQFNIHNSTFCPHTVFMCFVWISEQTAIISLYNINWLVFVTETWCVYCAVRTRLFDKVKSVGTTVYRWIKHGKLQVSLRADCMWEDKCADTSGGSVATRLLIISVHTAKAIAQCAAAWFLAYDSVAQAAAVKLPLMTSSRTNVGNFFPAHTSGSTVRTANSVQ